MSETMLSGKVTGVNGNMLSVAFGEKVTQNEVAYVITSSGERLKSEVIRVRGREADLQVFENTVGVKVGDNVEFGGLLGHSPILAVNKFKADKFIARGGRIPAPVRSLTN